MLWHKRVIDFHSEAGAKVVLYPHGGGIPTLSYDGVWEPDPRVFANFVTGIGHAEIMRRIDYPSQTHVVGWTFTDDLKPFRACTDVKRVLFAPTHPNGDGSMTLHQRSQNSEVFARLLETPFEITVRHRGTLEDNGLWKVPGVTFVDGRTSPLTAQLATSDVVVGAEGTFPTIAIAQGVPLVMYSEFVVALGLRDHEIIFPNRVDLYEDYARYPFSCDTGDIESVIREAALSDEPIAAYKRRFIGEPFHPLRFVELFERVITESLPTRLDPTRTNTTVAFADELAERPDLLRDLRRDDLPGRRRDARAVVARARRQRAAGHGRTGPRTGRHRWREAARHPACTVARLAADRRAARRAGDRAAQRLAVDRPAR